MVLCVYAFANCTQNARFKPMHVIEAKLCHHLVFQCHSEIFSDKKVIAFFFGDWSDVWPSINLQRIISSDLCPDLKVHKVHKHLVAEYNSLSRTNV